MIDYLPRIKQLNRQDARNNWLTALSACLPLIALSCYVIYKIW